MLRHSLIIVIFMTLLPANLFGKEPEMALIPAGNFNIGVSKKLIHLNKFYIDKTEVTQQEYKEVMGRGNFSFKGANHPAEQISWYRAASYCEKLGKRLPTQEEWEKAAKGQTKTKYFWGKKPDAAYAWYGGADAVINANDFFKGEHKHNTNDISKFKWKVRRIVEDCSVTDGEILC